MSDAAALPPSPPAVEPDVAPPVVPPVAGPLPGDGEDSGRATPRPTPGASPVAMRHLADLERALVARVERVEQRVGAGPAGATDASPWYAVVALVVLGLLAAVAIRRRRTP